MQHYNTLHYRVQILSLIHILRTLIRSLPQKYDCTVLVSSHLLPEVELMADDIGILNHGHLLFEGTDVYKRQVTISRRSASSSTMRIFLYFK